MLESTTVELDELLAVVERQRDQAGRRRRPLQALLVEAGRSVRPSPGDADALSKRFDARWVRAQSRVARAALDRESAQAKVRAQDAATSAVEREQARETLANRDIEVELARESMSIISLERSTWDLALRYYGEADPTALVEARERGPMLHARATRRIEFLGATVDSVLGRIGELDAMLAELPDDVEAAQARAMRVILEERLRLLQPAVLEQRQFLALLDRLRGDFDARVGSSSIGERLQLAWAHCRALIAASLNRELFSVEQTIEVDGRQTSVPRSVTVAKLLKVPVLLLVGWFVTVRATRWLEFGRAGAGWRRGGRAWFAAGHWA